jgi:polysaccharide pyruvyl transferase CsaB
MSKILISGYYGYKNIGDEAILKSIADFLKRNTHDSDITVLTADVEGAKERFGIRGADRNNLRKVISEVHRCDYLISGGGSLLQDVTSRRSIVYYFAILFLARLFGKKTIIYCQGIGPIEKKRNRTVAGWLLKRALYITVRDVQSEKELISLGIDSGKIHVSSDPVLAFPMGGKGSTNRVRKLLEEIGGKPVIGISLKRSDSKENINTIASDLNRLNREMDATFVFLPFHHLEDIEVYDEIGKLLNFSPVFVTDKYEVEEILELMIHMSFFIGLRLHSLILASVAELPFVALTYDPKIDHFLNAMELNPPLVYESIEAGQLYASVMNMLEKKEHYKELIRSGKAKNIKRLDESNEIIGKIIDERE